jgi:hypothetical protein
MPTRKHVSNALVGGHLVEGKSRRHADPRGSAAVLMESPAEFEPIDEDTDDEEAD